MPRGGRDGCRLVREIRCRLVRLLPRRGAGILRPQRRPATSHPQRQACAGRRWAATSIVMSMRTLTTTRLRPFEVAPPRVIKTSDLRADHLRRGARTVHRGRAVLPNPLASTDRRTADMLDLVAAIASRSPEQQWFCFEAAAVVWGCDTVSLGEHVDINQRFAQRRGADHRIRRHHSVIPSDQLAEVDGIPVTTLARTVVDCARSLPGRRALVIADSAVRQGVAVPDLQVVLESLGGRRGVRPARDLLRLADGGAESPGETLTRWALIDQGLPVPSTQVQVLTALGLRYGDIGWPDLRVLVEFDGRLKYSERYTADPVAAVVDEKRRQEAMEDAGWIVVRVMWEDLHHPGRLAARVRAAFARARRLGLASR